MMNSLRLTLLPAVLSLVLPALSLAQISVGVSVNVAPPELPVYDQPPIPGDGYLWTPGYWAWDDDVEDYYWVPGTWVPAPQPDYLWTPGYWGTDGAIFLWHAGYWGPHIGFYGGVNYGYGYGGDGYEGGYWRGGHLYYNRSVNNINNVNITNVYNRTVVNNVTVNRVSFNGGGGVQARPTAEQLAIAREPHVEATALQRRHVDAARGNPALRDSANRGNPPIAATSRPAAFTGSGVVAARNSAAPRALASPGTPAHKTTAPRANTTQRPALEDQQRNVPRDDGAQRAIDQRNAQQQSQQQLQQRQAQQQREREIQQRPAVEARPEPPQARPAPPQAPHPTAQPRAPEHPTERPEDHEHH